MDKLLNKSKFSRKRLTRYLEVECKAGRPHSPICEICHAVCGTVFDHDHETGRFRGWLCQNCNRALGHVHDRVDVLAKMILYVEHGGSGIPPLQDHLIASNKGQC